MALRCRPSQIWAVGHGGIDSAPGLNRVGSTVGPCSSVRILNQPVPPGFRESVQIGEQHLCTRAKELVGDRDRRAHEFSVQLRVIDADNNNAGLGLPVLVALCGAILGRNTRGGTVIIEPLNFGGSFEMIPNATRIAELALDKQAGTLLVPVAAYRQLADLPRRHLDKDQHRVL